MHAFELLVKLNAPFEGVQFDQRPVVWRLFAMIVEQVTEPDVSCCVARSYGDWVHANFGALRLVVDHYGIRYDDLSLLDLMPAWEQVELMQYVIDYFVDMVEVAERTKLSITSKKVQMLVPLTVPQIGREVDMYMRANEEGKEWQISPEATAAVDKAKWRAKTARWGAPPNAARFLQNPAYVLDFSFPTWTQFIVIF
ncbi:hypothetical protein RhiJN_04723 [Ceratobasidium sp. AG-Ba]|nr:hypothetical protein RhiJN_04723 [Ceratobasidium sp. AG-Ba]